MLAISLLLMGALSAMAIEEAKYKVVKKDGDIEVRDYEPQLVAETIVKASIEDSGNIAFRRLFNYISGKNQSKTKIEMTAPVSQESKGEKIAMTAPVSQQRSSDGEFAVSFMMPASFTMETIPAPSDEAVKIRKIPARRIAAIRYSGRWTEKRYLKFKDRLESWLKEQGLEPDGEPIWARYNPPFTLWFLRRNEVLIPIADKR